MYLEFSKLVFGYQFPFTDFPLDIKLSSAQLHILLGNNGCGKTTLIKTLARLIQPLSGEIFLDNQNIFSFHHSDFSKKIAFLFTHRPYLMQHTVMDLLILGRIPYLNWNGKISSEDKDIILHYAQLFNLISLLETPAHQISDGQLQKTLIAKTLIQQTPVIILDEPLSFLDYSTKKFILKTLKDIAINENKIILLSTHDVHLCKEYADTLLLIHKQQWIHQSVSNLNTNNLFIDFINAEV